MASLAPIHPPIPLQKAIGIASSQSIFPLEMNKTKEPRFEARLTNFAFAEAWRKSNPKIEINASIRKLPVPGPMNPS